MKEMKYVPELCKPKLNEAGEEVPALFKGEVTLKVPTFDERYELIDLMGVSVSTSGEVGMSSPDLSSIRKLVKNTRKYILKVELEKADGVKLSSVEDLECDSECDALLIELAMTITKGFKLGKT